MELLQNETFINLVLGIIMLGGFTYIMYSWAKPTPEEEEEYNKNWERNHGS